MDCKTVIHRFESDCRLHQIIKVSPKGWPFFFRALFRYLLPAAYFFELTPEKLGSKENKIPSVSPLQRGGRMFGFPLL